MTGECDSAVGHSCVVLHMCWGHVMQCCDQGAKHACCVTHGAALPAQSAHVHGCIVCEHCPAVQHMPCHSSWARREGRRKGRRALPPAVCGPAQHTTLALLPPSPPCQLHNAPLGVAACTDTACAAQRLVCVGCAGCAGMCAARCGRARCVGLASTSMCKHTGHTPSVLRCDGTRRWSARGGAQKPCVKGFVSRKG